MTGKKSLYLQSYYREICAMKQKRPIARLLILLLFAAISSFAMQLKAVPHLPDPELAWKNVKVEGKKIPFDQLNFTNYKTNITETYILRIDPGTQTYTYSLK